MRTTLSIEGMTCHHCSARVKKIIDKFEGIEDSEVNLEKKEASFNCAEETLIPRIIAAISDFGYPASEKS